MKNVPVSFADISAPLKFLVVKELQLDLLIWGPTKELLETRLDMGHNYIILTIHGMEVQLSLERKGSRTPSNVSTSIDSEYFTSECSDDESVLDECGDQNFHVVMMASDCNGKANYP